MNFIEAAKKSKFVRRNGLAKHCGSDGKGWIDAEYAFGLIRDGDFALLSWTDLMADDWEYRKQITIDINDFRDAVIRTELEERRFLSCSPLVDWTKLAKELKLI